MVFWKWYWYKQKNNLRCILMSAGIEIINNTGNIQITERFRNLQFIQKKTISLIPSGSTRKIDATLSSSTVVVAFKCSDGSNSPVGMYYNSGTDPTSVVFYASLGTSTVGITYYEFGYPVLALGSCFEIYNANSELVFSDNAKYLKVLGAYSGAVAISDFNNLGIGVPHVIASYSLGIPNIAVLFGSIARRWLHSYSTPGFLYTNQTFVFNSTTLINQLDVIGANAYNPTGYDSYDLSYHFLIVDVTNL